MKKLILFFSVLFFYHGTVSANCSYSKSAERVTINFNKAKVLSDVSLPTGAVLGVKKVGGNVASMRTFYGCQVDDFYSVMPSISATIAPGVKGIQGQPVYETGIPGIGFQISDAVAGTNFRPVPAIFQTVSARGMSSGSVEQITVWLIKTTEPIDTSVTSKSLSIAYKAGPASLMSGNDNLLLQINLNLGPFEYRQTTCDISPRSGSTITLQPIEARLLRDKFAGASTGREKDFYLDIKCPDDTVGSKYIYWFNPITENSTAKNGVLLNGIAESAGGAKDVGFILKMDNREIKFYDYTSYRFSSINKTEELAMNVDYYKTSNTISAGQVKAIFEVVLQEE